MKTLREMINLIESVNAPADGYLLMLYNYPYSIHKTPEEAQVAIENSGESDGSWKVVPFQFGANLGESAVAEDQASARMGLMSAMGSNSDAPDQRQQAAQAIERLYNK